MRSRNNSLHTQQQQPPAATLLPLFSRASMLLNFSLATACFQSASHMRSRQAGVSRKARASASFRRGRQIDFSMLQASALGACSKSSSL